MAARHTSLYEAMVAEDDLAEAKLRYKLLAEVFEAEPKLRGNLNPALERAKAEILRLRAVAAAKPAGSTGSAVVVPIEPFDPNRFRKSTG